MRRSLALTVFTAMLLVSLINPTTALPQESTPTGTTSLAPSVGVPFHFRGSEGEEANITILEIVDPFDDLREGYEPEPSARYVMISVVYENTGSMPVETRPDAFALQDADGNMWSTASIEQDEGGAIPDLQRVEIAPGDRVTGLVGFQIPASAETARVFYQPESSRLLLLAELNATAQSATAIGAPVEYADAETNAEGTLTVTEIVDPFEDTPEGYEAESGSRYVLVTIQVENTGSVPLPVSPGNVITRDHEGYLWANTSINRGDQVTIPDLQSQDLAPGSRISGVVGFQLPSDGQLADVIYQPVGGRLIFLARLQQSESGTAADASAASSIDCDGIEVWYAESKERIDRATALSREVAKLESEDIVESAALEFSELAEAQQMIDVPPGAEALNDTLTRIFTQYHEALTTIATAGDDGGSVELALVSGMNAFNDTSTEFDLLQPRINELVAGCS